MNPGALSVALGLLVVLVVPGSASAGSQMCEVGKAAATAGCRLAAPVAVAYVGYAATVGVCVVSWGLACAVAAAATTFAVETSEAWADPACHAATENFCGAR